MSTILKDKTSNAFIEQDCTIELDGKSFTSGGAWLCGYESECKHFWEGIEECWKYVENEADVYD